LGLVVTTNGRLRRVDSLGRVVLPADLRHALGIREGDTLAIDVSGSSLVMTKATPVCVFCGSAADLRELSGKQACVGCVSTLSAPDAAR
jgi:transcriptional pleiotropic regulator of transition state genes